MWHAFFMAHLHIHEFNKLLPSPILPRTKTASANKAKTKSLRSQHFRVNNRMKLHINMNTMKMNKAEPRNEAMGERPGKHL